MPLMVCLKLLLQPRKILLITTILLLLLLLLLLLIKKNEQQKLGHFLNTYHGLDSKEGKNVPTTNVYFTTTDKETKKKDRRVFYTFWLRLANLCFDQSISRHLENITTTFWLWLCWCVKSYYYNSLQKQQKGKIAEISKKPYQWSLPSPGWSLELPDW